MQNKSIRLCSHIFELSYVMLNKYIFLYNYMNGVNGWFLSSINGQSATMPSRTQLKPLSCLPEIRRTSPSEYSSSLGNVFIMLYQLTSIMLQALMRRGPLYAVCGVSPKLLPILFFSARLQRRSGVL